MSLDMIGALGESLAPPAEGTASPFVPQGALRVPPPAVLASRFLAPQRAARVAAAKDASVLSWLPWILVGTGVIVAGTGWYVMTKDAAR
jgi:hypothetical protein